jgi:hypothetical protein
MAIVLVSDGYQMMLRWKFILQCPTQSRMQSEKANSQAMEIFVTLAVSYDFYYSLQILLFLDFS